MTRKSGAIKLTPRVIEDALKSAAREGGNLELADADIKGLIARVYPSGTVTFSLLYRPRGEKAKKRLTVGKYPHNTIAEARGRAKIALGQVAAGGDPVADQRQERADAKRVAVEADLAAKAQAERMTVRMLAERFLQAKRNLRWYPRYKGMLDYNLLSPPKDLKALHMGIADKAAEDLSSKDIDDILTAIIGRGSPKQARRVFEVIRAMVKFGIKKGYITHDPMQGVTTPENSEPRLRYLSVEELRKIWRDFEVWDCVGCTSEGRPIPLAVVRVLRLELLLAQRSGEISGMCKHELSDDGYEWTIPEARTKNGLEQVVPLPPMAREIISAACAASEHPSFVFPVRARKGGGYKPLRSDVISGHVGKALNLHFDFRDRQGAAESFVAHDLRRTVATYLGKMSTRPDVIAALMNHKSAKSGDVTSKHYNHAEHLHAIRVALTRWQEQLAVIADGADPFAQNVEDIAELERRTINRTRGARLAVVGGGRA